MNQDAIAQSTLTDIISEAHLNYILNNLIFEIEGLLVSI